MLMIKGNQLYVRSYIRIVEINDQRVVVDFNEYRLSMSGEDFHILALEKNEMHMEGRLFSLHMIYEK